MCTYALHGFLGLPSDWEFLPDENVKAIDLFNEPIKPFWEWAETFNARVSNDGQQKRTLIGYSMGGRLALHALILQPELWDRVVIVSSHPGLECQTAQKIRRMNDFKWSWRFEQESWEEVMAVWNEQSIFLTGPKKWKRKEEQFDRQQLRRALVTWSLGEQDNLRESIRSIHVPILWLAGENDLKYCELAQECADLSPSGKYCCISDAGHRAPWEQPEEFLSSMG